jgi:hypothetical protein
MAAGKKQDIAAGSAKATHHSVRPRANLIRRFPSRAAVTKKLPARALGKNLGRTAAFIITVIPFEQVAIDFSPSAEAGQLAGTRCTLQGTGENLGESETLQPLSEPAGIALAALSQRQVR